MHVGVRVLIGGSVGDGIRGMSSAGYAVGDGAEHAAVVVMECFEVAASGASWGVAEEVGFVVCEAEAADEVGGW